METNVYPRRVQRSSLLRLSTLSPTDFGNNYLFKRNLTLFLLIIYPFITSLTFSQLGQFSDRNSAAVAYAALSLPYILLSGLYLHKIVLLKNDILTISAFLVFLATFSGLIIGLFGGWQTRDIIGDTARFITPFLSFALFSLVFSNLTAKALGRLFVFLIYFSIFQMLSGLLGRLGDLFFNEGAIFKYGEGGFGSASTLTVVTLILLYKYFTTSWRCLTLISLLLYATNPILSVSKSEC